MGYLKKLMCFVMAATLAVTLCCCGGKGPGKTVSEKIDSMKNKTDHILNNVKDDSENGSQESNSIGKNKEAQNKILAAMNKTSYKINSEKVDKDTAIVNVTVNGPDIGKVRLDFQNKVYSDILNNKFNSDTTSDEQLDSKYDEVFMEMLDNIEFSDRTMDVELVKKDDGWEIKDGKVLLKLVMNIEL